MKITPDWHKVNNLALFLGDRERIMCFYQPGLHTEKGRSWDLWSQAVTLAQFKRVVRSNVLQLRQAESTVYIKAPSTGLNIWPAPDPEDRKLYARWAAEVWADSDHGIARAFTHLKAKTKTIGTLLRKGIQHERLVLVPIHFYPKGSVSVEASTRDNNNQTVCRLSEAFQILEQQSAAQQRRVELATVMNQLLGLGDQHTDEDNRQAQQNQQQQLGSIVNRLHMNVDEVARAIHRAIARELVV